jgi:hypothetical protein
MNTITAKNAHILGVSRQHAQSYAALSVFVDEIFQKKIEQFKKERQRILKKSIPLSENL